MLPHQNTMPRYVDIPFSSFELYRKSYIEQYLGEEKYKENSWYSQNLKAELSTIEPDANSDPPVIPFTGMVQFVLLFSFDPITCTLHPVLTDPNVMLEAYKAKNESEIQSYSFSRIEVGWIIFSKSEDFVFIQNLQINGRLKYWFKPRQFYRYALRYFISFFPKVVAPSSNLMEIEATKLNQKIPICTYSKNIFSGIFKRSYFNGLPIWEYSNVCRSKSDLSV